MTSGAGRIVGPGGYISRFKPGGMWGGSRVSAAGIPVGTASNLFTKTEAFDNAAWTKTRTTISANAIAAPAPYGTTTADGVIADTNNLTHLVSMAATLTVATYTTSVYAKKGNRDWFVIFENTLGNGVAFDLTSGVVGNRYAATANITGAIVDVGSGWYRCSVTFTGTAASRVQQFFPATGNLSANSSNAVLVFVGDGAAINTYLWGAQCEIGSLATTYTAVA